MDITKKYSPDIDDDFNAYVRTYIRHNELQHNALNKAVDFIKEIASFCDEKKSSLSRLFYFESKARELLKEFGVEV